MDATRGIELMQQLIARAEKLRSQSLITQAEFDGWANTARDYLKRTFGSHSPNVDAVLNAPDGDGYEIGMGPEQSTQYLRSGLQNRIAMLRSCIDQLAPDVPQALRAESSEAPPAAVKSDDVRSKVFVVHGRDSHAMEAVARFVEKCNLEAVVLAEKPNIGLTVIEKFEEYSEVQFAVVLLTGDDEGRLCGGADPLQRRARQNVILELGFFMGKLGRKRVCVLYESDVEIPSDYRGVLYIPLDGIGHWKVELLRDLNAAGFGIDANKVLRT